MLQNLFVLHFFQTTKTINILLTINISFKLLLRIGNKIWNEKEGLLEKDLLLKSLIEFSVCTTVARL